jgi:hypothetical protein
MLESPDILICFIDNFTMLDLELLLGLSFKFFSFGLDMIRRPFELVDFTLQLASAFLAKLFNLSIARL